MYQNFSRGLLLVTAQDAITGACYLTIASNTVEGFKSLGSHIAQFTGHSISALERMLNSGQLDGLHAISPGSGAFLSSHFRLGNNGIQNLSDGFFDRRDLPPVNREEAYWRAIYPLISGYFLSYHIEQHTH